jgi:hypothetical protein
MGNGKGRGDKGSWPRIIEAVKTFPGFSTALLLALTPVFITAVTNASAEQKPLLLRYLLVGAGLLALANFAYFVYEGSTELTFQIRFLRSVANKEPADGIQVKLYKNGQVIDSSLTNEEGVVSFTIRVGRKDEFYVQVADPHLPARKASLCNRGQFQFARTVILG